VSSPSPDAPAFDAHAADYEAQLDAGLRVSGEGKAYFARGRVDDLRMWWRRAGRAEPHEIVDWGCGLGDGSALLAAAFPSARVIGIDPSERLLERARSAHAGPRVRFERPDSRRAPGIAADLVHLNGVVHHVEPADREQMFAALARITAPGGVVALFENNPLNPGTRIVMSRIPFDRDAVPVPPREARRRLRGAGLRPVATRHLFYFPRALRALRPIERFLARVPLGAQYGVYAVASRS